MLKIDEIKRVKMLSKQGSHLRFTFRHVQYTKSEQNIHTSTYDQIIDFIASLHTLYI